MSRFGVYVNEEGGIERRTTLSKTKLPKGKQIHQASHVNDDSRGFFVESSQMIIKYLRSELVQTFTYLHALICLVLN